MAQVVVIKQTPREGGMVEVQLSADSIGWTVHVPAVIADSPEAMTVYQAMADNVLGEHERLAGIQAINRNV